MTWWHLLIPNHVHVGAKCLSVIKEYFMRAKGLLHEFFTSLWFTGIKCIIAILLGIKADALLYLTQQSFPVHCGYILSKEMHFLHYKVEWVKCHSPSLISLVCASGAYRIMGCTLKADLLLYGCWKASIILHILSLDDKTGSLKGWNPVHGPMCHLCWTETILGHV